MVAQFLLSGFMYSWDRFFIYPALGEKLDYTGPSGNEIMAARHR